MWHRFMNPIFFFVSSSAIFFYKPRENTMVHNEMKKKTNSLCLAQPQLFQFSNF